MKKRWIPFVAIALLIAIWIAALIKCEVLTLIYNDDFQSAYMQNTMLGEIEYFRVLKCNGRTAEVYYVSKGMTAGNVLSFEKKNGTWEETSYQTIWSVAGTASEVIYPYWWHFIYGGL